MLSLDNAYNEDGAARVRRARPRTAPGSATRPPLRRRAEDRRPEHRADLRATARCVRGATRGDGVARRGRHAERPHDPRHPAVAAGGGAGPQHRGRAARCYLPRASFERMNREREEAGGAALRRTPATPRRGRCATSIRRSSRSAASARSCISWSYAEAVREPRMPDAQRATLEALRALGLPVEPHWRALRGHRRRASTFCQRVGRRPARPRRSTPTASSSRSTTSRCASRLGTTAKFPRWATAFKFPAQQAHDDAAEDRASTSAGPAP